MLYLRNVDCLRVNEVGKRLLGAHTVPRHVHGAELVWRTVSPESPGRLESMYALSTDARMTRLVTGAALRSLAVSFVADQDSGSVWQATWSLSAWVLYSIILPHNSSCHGLGSPA